MYLFIFVILALSYNQPKIDPYATWNLDAITFANKNTIGSNPRGIFVDSNNTVYVPNRDTGKIHIWINDSINATEIEGDLLKPHAVFVTMNGDIYVDNGQWNDRVDKWTSSTNTWTTVMYVDGSCHGLFVDINNTIYCSMFDFHQVVKISLNDNAITSSIAAGTGTPNSTSDTLAGPDQIFVDTNFDLYVADWGNNRIQFFQSGQLNAITIAGDGSPNITIRLYGPSGIVLDADKYLFILEYNIRRIVRSGPTGFRCIVGCFVTGSSFNNLFGPHSLSFDSYGNIFVVDESNHRIQKFLLSTNSRGKYKSSSLKDSILKHQKSFNIQYK
jgi:hypothetical protein